MKRPARVTGRKEHGQKERQAWAGLPTSTSRSARTSSPTFQDEEKPGLGRHWPHAQV